MEENEIEYYNFLAYIKKTISFEANHLKSKQNKYEVNNSFDTEILEDREISGFENQIIAKEIVNKALSQLSDKQRLVIELHYFEDKSITEIAKMLNISRQSANQAKNRALQKMEVFINGNDNESC